MKSLVLGIAAATLLSGGISLAQTTQGAGPGTGSTATAPGTSAPGVGSAAMSGPAAASGNNNQAVATTNANAATPAKGANSFTSGEAKSRIEKNGYSNVGTLQKDDNGVWRGPAQKNGTQTNVWLDYKGNVGETK